MVANGFRGMAEKSEGVGGLKRLKEGRSKLGWFKMSVGEVEGLESLKK